MFVKNLIASLIIHTIICYNIPSRKSTDYYELMGGELCIPIHHTLPKGSEFIRLRIFYYVYFAGQASPIKRETNYYLKRTDSNNCAGEIAFSALGKQLDSGHFSISISWDIFEDYIFSKFDYSFKDRLDLTIKEFVSRDDLFAIPVKLLPEGQDFLDISHQISTENLIGLLSHSDIDNEAICVKLDNNKITVLHSSYVGDKPTWPITHVQIDATKTGSVFSKKYHAYACGPDIQHTKSNLKLVIDSCEVTTKFYAISKKYKFISGENYETEEKRYEFNLNDEINYEYADDQTEVHYDDEYIYLFETRMSESICPRHKCLFYRGISYQNKNLYAYKEFHDRISAYTKRYRSEPLSYLLQC